MKRFGWLAAFVVGAAGAFFIGWRKRSGELLGSPLDDDGLPSTTSHGFFGAARKGPPVHFHQGIDLAAKPGSRVLAVGDGRIVATDPGLGKIVRKLRLDIPNAWTWSGAPIDSIVYADLGEPLVDPGERVRQGDSIAFVDRPGFVHFAVKQGSRFVDPKTAGFAYRSGGSSWLV